MCSFGHIGEGKAIKKLEFQFSGGMKTRHFDTRTLTLNRTVSIHLILTIARFYSQQCTIEMGNIESEREIIEEKN